MIEQLIHESLEDVDEVKRWIDNDVAAGDEAIQIHADALERAHAKLDEAAELARKLAEAE